MRFTLLLGAICGFVGIATAQQYLQRPTNFAAASQTEPIQRQRQRRPVVRARANSIQDSEDVYIRQRVIPTAPPVLQTPKPVVEEDEYEDDVEGTTPSSISRSAYVGPYAPPAQPAPAPFRPQNVQQSSIPVQRPAFLQPSAFRPSPQLNQPQVIRQLARPSPVKPASPVTRPPPPPSTPPQSILSSEEEEEDDEYVRQPVRPQLKPEPPVRQVVKPLPVVRQQVVRQQEPSQPRPYPSKAAAAQKERKPVVQTVRKFHDENEDGSITWGYENDDGSFKEETIGVDCVTRGKYGYYDPDGVKREYTYQTGIPCDRQAEAEQAASNNEGYIDYTSNTYVLPNGDEIDLDEMVKNRARKPVGKYRN